MLPRTYTGQDCSIARALEAVGERWTLLIVREALNGTRRFEDFQRSLGIARNVLASRLGRLCEEGVLERREYSEHPPRAEYVPTAKGEDLLPVALSLMAWGDRYYADPAVGPPVVYRHEPCGKTLTPQTVCSCCGETVEAGRLTARAGGARP